jgi:hypothetical protein
MTWFWSNWLLGALIVVAYCSIPVWLVLRQRGKAPQMDAVQRARMLTLTETSTAAVPTTGASRERDAA